MSSRGTSTDTGRPKLDVIIPARGETGDLARCLGSLWASDPNIDLRVVVVANGPEGRASQSIAEEVAADKSLPTGAFQSVWIEEGSKTAALNKGDELSRGCSIMYLDADIRLLPNTLCEIAMALSCADGPLLVGPPRVFAATKSLATYSYTKVFGTLPGVAGEVIALGCYAVNQAGRARWGRFPPVTNDDAFVRSRFDPDERQIVGGGGAVQKMPEGIDLVKTVARWRAGNRELRQLAAQEPNDQQSAPGAGMRRNLAHLLRTPSIWPHFPFFIWINFRARGTEADSAAGPWRPLGRTPL